MKRAFLFGLGSYLFLLALAGAITAFAGYHSNRIDIVTGVIFLVVSAPLSLKAVLSAKAAPPNRSHLHAVLGWLIGFFLIAAAMVALGGIIWLLT